jgi:hypothetical protein
VEVERISDKDRVEDTEIWSRFNELKSELLGYIFDRLSKYLKIESNGGIGKLKSLPRMADFAKVCETLSRCMGYDDGEFVRVYGKNIGLQIQEAIDSNIIASLIIKFMESNKVGRWEGSPTSLYTGLEYLAEVMRIDTNSKSWPKSPSKMSKRLNEVRTILRQVGYEVEFNRESSERAIIITKFTKTTLIIQVLAQI